jgi:hypothetical protein
MHGHLKKELGVLRPTGQAHYPGKKKYMINLD